LFSLVELQLETLLTGTMAYLSDTRFYQILPRKDHRGVDLISDALPFGGLWYTKPDDVIGCAQFYSRSHDAAIRVYDTVGNVIETHEHAVLHRRARRIRALATH
jgi:hypothetical protein